MDLALDDAGDLDISSSDLALVDGDDDLRQHVGIRCRFVKGEWFLDPRVGVPYYERILVKNPDLAGIRGIYRRAIASTPGIAGVTSLSLTLDRPTRRASLSFQAKKDDGAVLDFSGGFIL